MLRIRTPLTGVNGADLEFHLLDAIRPGCRGVVAARFAAGVVTMSAECGSHYAQSTLELGLLQSWATAVNARIHVHETYLLWLTLWGAAVCGLGPIAILASFSVGSRLHRP